MVAAKHGYILFSSLLEVRTWDRSHWSKVANNYFFLWQRHTHSTWHHWPCFVQENQKAHSTQQPCSPPVILLQRLGDVKQPRFPSPLSSILLYTKLNSRVWFLKSSYLQAGDQAAHRSPHLSYNWHSPHRISVIWDRALILCHIFCHVAEKQPAWADQRSHSQTHHTLLAHRHSHPEAATGAAGLPLQEVQCQQTGAVPQIPHCPWCCGKPLHFGSITTAKTCKPRHASPIFFPRCWPTSSPAPPHWRPCRAPTSAWAVGIMERL